MFRRSTAFWAFWGLALSTACSVDLQDSGAASTADGTTVAEAQAALSVCTGAMPLDENGPLEYSALPNISFLPPASVYSSNPTAVAQFLANARPSTILSPPFLRTDVVLGSGWHYDSGKSHRGIDYSRDSVATGQDPTFAVLAMGDGIVRAVMPMSMEVDNGGNTIVIEHVDPSRRRPSSWSLYMHLRNGAKNDVAAVEQDLPCDEGGRYKKWAEKNPTHVTWGTDAQVMMVTVGQSVQRGQQIAWAGNTGCGAAWRDLDANGDPEDSDVNTHLHIYYAVVDPALTSNGKQIGVMLDPYGVFSTADTGCYASPSQKPEYRRHIRPFSADFHHVEADALLNHPDYYPDLGFLPQTLSLASESLVHPVVAAGSYRGSSAASSQSAIAYSSQMFDIAIDAHASAGFRPRRPSVMTSPGGDPLFTATFERLASGETYQLHKVLSPAAFSSIKGSLESQGMRVDDFFEWELNGSAMITAGFTSQQASSGKFYQHLLPATVAPIVAAETAAGNKATLVNRSLATGNYALVFVPSTDCAVVKIGLEKAAYQEFYDDFVAVRGYAVHQLQLSNEEYAVIVRRAPVGTSCP